MNTNQKHNPRYRQPPIEHRFQKGQTGNPRGRPKKAEDLSTIVAEELSRVIVVVENGRRVRRTVREAIVNVLFELALQGDQKAFDLVLEWTTDNHKPTDQPIMRFTIDGLEPHTPEFDAREERFRAALASGAIS